MHSLYIINKGISLVVYPLVLAIQDAIDIVTAQKSHFYSLNITTKQTKHVESTLVHRLRRWTNIKPTLNQRLVSPGKEVIETSTQNTR